VKLAYDGVHDIGSDPAGQLHYRTDIAHRALGNGGGGNNGDGEDDAEGKKRAKVG
jgi:hypothetical protein